jgi:predicted metal-dependent peptidase
MDTTARQTIVKARAALILDHPFFGALALRLLLKEDTGCKTSWVDGVTLGYNPVYINSLPMDEVKALVCHEVLHLALAHHTRRNDRDFDEWNEACDFPTNQTVHDVGMPIGKGWLFDPLYKDLNSETIYDKRHREKQQGGGNGPGNQPGQPQPGQPQPGQPQPGQGKGQGTPQPVPGEVRDLPGTDGQPATQTQKDISAQDWQVAATQAAQQAKACGRLPGNIEELIEKLNEPKVNWKEALQRFVEQQAKNDYSFRRINPRFAGRGVCLPSLHSEELPPIRVAIDTSASVSKEELEQFASEIDDILFHYPTTVETIYCDTRVNGTETFSRENRPVKLNVKGRGGTRFSPAFEHVEKLGEETTCLIYLSDMDCDDFGPAPDYPVLWVQTMGKAKKVPFGELIRMNK